MNRCLLALVAALCLAAPAAAYANGRFPAAQYLLVGPGASSRTVALMTTFGPVVSDDGGATFHWICEPALQYPGGQWDASMAIDATGALHFGLPTGVIRAEPGRCAFPRAAALEGDAVVDLDQSDDGGVVVAAAVLGDMRAPRGQLFRAPSGGTWAPLGDALPGVLFTTLELSRSDPSRLYATAQVGEALRPTFLRSDDGGARLRELPFMLDTPLDLRAAYIASIDPVRPDTVYVRALLGAQSDGGAALDASALLRTDDGGRTFRVLARMEGAMRGFAISDDGRTLWIGSAVADEGLRRSDDGGVTFRRVAAVPVQGLRFHRGALYVSTSYTVTGYALARSVDGGETLSALLRFEDVAGAFSCASPSPERDLCAPAWPDLRARSFFTTQRDAGVDAADADGAVDAGADGGGAIVVAPGCACARPGGRCVAWGVALCMAALAGRRRARRS